METSGPGAYTVAWTAVLADGDQGEGDFVFSVAGGAEPPNTAVVMPQPDVPQALGPILLVAALLFALRRARRACS